MAPSVQLGTTEETLQEQQEVSSSEESAVPEEGKGGVARLERPKKCFLHKKPRPHTCPKCRRYAQEMEVFNKGLIEMADPTRKATSESTKGEEVASVAGVDVDGTGALVVVNQGPLYGLYPTLVQNIQSSDYFNKGLRGMSTVEEVVEEVERAVEHAEPYNVGALNIPSTMFCCLYKLCSKGQARPSWSLSLGTASRRYVVCLGLLYLRCVAQPSSLWTWFYPVLFDTTVFHPEEVTGEAQAAESMMLGRYAELLLLTHKYFTVNLNRLPETILQKYGMRCILLDTEGCRINASQHPEAADQISIVGSYVFVRDEESGGWELGQIVPGGDATLGLVEVRLASDTRQVHWSSLRSCRDVAAARRAVEAEAFTKEEAAASARKEALKQWRQQQREFANARAFRVYAGWQSRGVVDDIHGEDLQSLPQADVGEAEAAAPTKKRRVVVSKEFRQQQDAMLKRKYIEGSVPKVEGGREDQEEPDVGYIG
ncbi:conserved hypothetical protein [Perkinsus marinus ATCC 50983]|uniref:Pre-mRNA-splicing factor 38 n=1 Tax=Perkinsus marinus (strain ATCC 50983 / TXsc) TaxID=423536 RepID=C5K6I2_PERM5|nr:conserved hypothetical protein [Perkinsus marinus ATCC 50983]EER19902.1 conserved hypothetical protein [Perkinsus marinus ATCC 50983]|eukprot:XP_002788106.1 conserved hypothetical protein [Perkinsus marinus ATCC 50983]